MNNIESVARVPVPRDVSGWEKSVPLFNLNEAVRGVFWKILAGETDIEREDFLKYLDGIYDSQTIEGTLALDNAEAARIIRNTAKKLGQSRLGETKLDAVIKSLNHVLKRAGLARKDRRDEAESNGNDE